MSDYSRTISDAANVLFAPLHMADHHNQHIDALLHPHAAKAHPVIIDGEGLPEGYGELREVKAPRGRGPFGLLRVKPPENNR